jgi:sigma-E factor negative regulatory protein RseC
VDESKEKIVEIDNVDASRYNVGESVEVALQSDSMGAKAVVLTYVVPFFVLVAALVGAVACGLGEGPAVVAALGGVAAYYLLLYVLRHKIKSTIKFIIIKQTK